MRQLGRTASPPCLGDYRHGEHNWDDVTPAHKAELRAALDAMQGARCAYCEQDLSRTKATHIDHFIQRSLDPTKTFEWTNLFRSCGHPDHCGFYKDGKGRPYSAPDLIKADTENPRKGIQFLSDGSVTTRKSADVRDAQRARETIRILHLDAPRLRGMRKAYLSPLTGELDDVLEAGLSPAERDQYLRDLATSYQNQPFFAAVLDFLGLPPDFGAPS